MSDSFTLDRRTVVKGITVSAVAAAPGLARAQTAGGVKKYAIVGCGSRSRMYQDAIWGAHAAHASLVGICDVNPARLAYVGERAAKAGVKAPPAYAASDFKKMLETEKPDTVIVTTPDGFHDIYIVDALDGGCDVMTEKPMTITAPKAQRIIDAVKRSGKHVRVTFNYRYAPFRSQLKEILMSGEIGEILSVDFHWLLNTLHGADYFRRWHSNKAISGGLMVHKATHHFDLVNWWLSAQPVSVRASGKRDFYTPAMAKRMGLKGPHERCLSCPEKEKCTFHLDIAADPAFKALYLDAEKYDGYFRDRCVWRKEISIEDTMNVIVDYDTGVTLSYSLNAFNAWEGYMIAFNGTKGRLEHRVVEQAFAAGATITQRAREQITTTLVPLRRPPVDIPVRTGEGGHGGGDAVLLADLFDPNAPADPLMRAADFRAGAASMLIGAAANICFEEGGPVVIADLVDGLKRPDLTPMPDHKGPVPMPPL